MEEGIKYNLTKDKEREITYFGLTNVELSYTFFYDETNNIRRLILRNQSTNIKLEELDNNFILGGVVYEDDTKLTSKEFEKLKQDLKIDKNNNEVKFKHIAKGGFLDTLKSRKLKTFLSWILENNLYIHYSSLDIFFWSIVDIIESSVKHYPNFQWVDLHLFKTLFYEFSKINRSDFLLILYKYNYPNIDRKKNKKFINELIKYIDKYKDDIESIRIADKVDIQILIDILRYAKSKELVFIEDNVPLELIDQFGIFYQRPIGLYTNSEHIFDEEKQVIEYFKQFSFYDEDRKLNNFTFKKSDECFFIQLSDMVVGFIGKFMAFVNKSNLFEIENLQSELNSLQIENLKLLYKVLNKSQSKCNAFLHYIAPATTVIKIVKLNEVIMKY